MCEFQMNLIIIFKSRMSNSTWVKQKLHALRKRVVMLFEVFALGCLHDGIFFSR